MTEKILLINPYSQQDFKVNNRFVPLGLLYLASSMMKAGFAVAIKDTKNETVGMYETEISDYLNTTFVTYLKRAKPDFIGISVQFSVRFQPALKIVEIVKDVLGDEIPVVFGGPHLTLFYDRIIKEYPFIDYIIIGEGEQSTVELVNAHFNDKRLLREINGLAYRENGSTIINPKTGYIKDLDSIPFPAYELLNIKDYYFDTSDWHNPKNLPINYNFPILSSRGCPGKCTFCAARLGHGLTYRTRSAKNVVDEIQYLYDDYNCRYLSFIDDNMSVSKKRIMEMMSEICNRNLDIQFDTSNGLEINTIDDEMMNAMVNAGHIRTAVAIESGSEYIRNVVVKKNLTDETIYKFFDMTKKHKDLRCVGYFMCGFPQETEETLNATFEMIKRLPLDDVAMSTVVPFYGTELFEYCREHGLLTVDIENLHKVEDMTYTGEFHIKPFNIDIASIQKFRENVFEYIRGG